jgi:hypothetical protein
MEGIFYTLSYVGNAKYIRIIRAARNGLPNGAVYFFASSSA